MTISYKNYKYVPLWILEENLNYCDKIRELKCEIKENNKKRNILLEKIHNLEIQNYLLKKRKGE